MHTVNFLRHIIENHQAFIYPIILLGLIIEGEFILISSGILMHLGALNIYLTSIFIVLGLASKTFLGYYIGIFIHTRCRHMRALKYIEQRVRAIMPNFKRRPFWSIFTSKFILGANNIVMIFSGYHKIDFKRYLQAELASTLLWAPAMLIIGYFFSFTALNISHEIWRFSFIIILFVVSFILLDKCISWVYEFFEDVYDEHR